MNLRLMLPPSTYLSESHLYESRLFGHPVQSDIVTTVTAGDFLGPCLPVINRHRSTLHFRYIMIEPIARP